MENERENRNQPQSSPPRERASRHIAEAPPGVPRSVDLHLTHQCNYSCRFCYFTRDGHLASVPIGQEPSLDLEAFRSLQRILTSAGVERITYAGGEPTISPHLWSLISDWHRLHGGDRQRVMIVTNGTGLSELRVRLVRDAIAAIKLGGESNDDTVEAALGRSRGNHVQLLIDRADMLHRLGIEVQLNSVVCSLNKDEDLTPLVRRVSPRYWKLHQFLPVPGQNDSAIEQLQITEKEFRRFQENHAHLRDLMVAEDNDLMRGSYAMVDPLGRFFQSTPEGYVRSRHSMLEVGVEAALAEIGLDWGRYNRRGGDERAFRGRMVA